MSPAYEVRVSLRGADGRVRVRSRLCWTDPPSAAAVLDALALRALDARRRGLELVVEAVPAGVEEMLALTGLSGPDGPVRDGSGGDRGGQAELGEH